jgi:hypothetical protein
VLYLDEYGQHRSLHNRDGTFVFEDLAPGRHELLLQARGVLAAEVRLTVDLAAGETREVVIDVADRAPCEVTVEVRWSDGRPAEKVQILAQREEAGRFRHESFEPVGFTDAGGRVVGRVASGGRVRLVACADGHFAIAHGEPFVPAAGGVYATALTASAGELVLRFPDEEVYSNMRGFDLRLARDGDEEDVGWLFKRPASVPGLQRAGYLIAPGRYAMRLTVTGGTRWSSGSEEWMRSVVPVPLRPIEDAIEIVAGETTVFEVPRP